MIREIGLLPNHLVLNEGPMTERQDKLEQIGWVEKDEDGDESQAVQKLEAKMRTKTNHHKGTGQLETKARGAAPKREVGWKRGSCRKQAVDQW